MADSIMVQRPNTGAIKEFLSPVITSSGEMSAALIISFNAMTIPTSCVNVPQTKLNIPRKRMAWCELWKGKVLGPGLPKYRMNFWIPRIKITTRIRTCV